ncbi:MAG: hypothetical protein J6L60_00245 [Bacteroidaceae bacterium]|nr:hypothetical protein [Bacteroidaceae bacterium]
MKRLYLILISVLSLFSLCGCSEEEWAAPTTLKGGVWQLTTPLPLQDYFTYEPGRCIAFSEKSSQGWIGTDEKDRYKVIFTYEQVRNLQGALSITLHTYTENTYYISDAVVDGKEASLLLFGSYDDFYLHHIKGEEGHGIPVKLVLQRRCK